MKSSYNLAYIWTICLAAALGGFLFGCDWVVIGGAKPFYELYFNLTTPAQIGWAMSCAIVGCLIGSIVAGIASRKCGQRKLLIASALLFAGSSMGTGQAHEYIIFVLWRIAGGIAIGLASNLSPIYVSEVAPAHFRGRLVAVNQLMIVLGVVAAQISNWLIAKPVLAGAVNPEILASWNGQTGWRWMFEVTAVPAVLFLVSMIFAPESPRWLCQQGRTEEARRVLARIGGIGFADDSIAEIEGSLQPTSSEAGIGGLFEPRLRRVLALGIFLAWFQQWCGINTVFNYAQEIFSAAGYRVSDILFNIVITGLVLVVFTCVAIGTVDRFGRRILMLMGSAGLTASYIALGIVYHFGLRGTPVLLLVLAAIAFYAFSLAPVTWVILSEIYPNRVRGPAMSLAVFNLWAACFTLVFTYPFLNSKLGAANTFWVYGGVCFVGLAVVALFLPETKGKTLEQIEHQLTSAPGKEGHSSR